MSHPKVSVITPSFNRGQLIEATIRSVLNQTFKNIEYIVVDGLSTDNTLSILKSYGEKGRLQYISERDDGMYFAINKGINKATGDIIAYINSDDLYFPWTVDTVVNVFRDDNDVDMVYGDSMILDYVTNRKYLNIYASHRKLWLESGGIICQPTVFFRRKVVESVGYFNSDYKYLADCEYWLRVNQSSKLKIVKIDEVLAIECNHEETFREKMKSEIAREKHDLFMSFGREVIRNKSLPLSNIKHKVNKELKLWKFIFSSYSERHGNYRWNNFLRNYHVRFSPLNYLLCKLFFKRSKYPRFSIKESVS